MRNISNITGQVGYGEESGEVGNSAEITPREKLLKKLIFRANSTPVLQVFKYYKIRIDAFNRRITCPFTHHKNGQERTPSFWYYPDTNSFYCHGCSTGSRAVDFVAIMDGTSKEKAARKILELFDGEFEGDVEDDQNNLSERLQLLLQFSAKVLEFRQTYNTKHAFDFIEYLSWVYDQINIDRKPINQSLKELNLKFFEIIDKYNSNQKILFESNYLKIGK